MQNSFQNKNLSTNSGNLSILSAALAMSSSQNLSSRMSSRLSMQSKKRLVALHAVDKKNQYNNLYKDIKINKTKIQKDLQWLQEKLEQLSSADPAFAEKKVSRADFYVYGGSLMAHQQASLIHSYLYANLSEMVDVQEMEDVGAKQTLVVVDAEDK